MHVRQAVAVGDSALEVARSLAEQLRAPDLRIVFVFVDWQLDPVAFAAELHRGVAPARVVGGTTTGVIGPVHAPGKAATALGLYGDWVRVGIGVASDLASSALTRSRDAMVAAATEMRTTLEALSPLRHVGITLVDGKCGQEDVFCIGSAASASQIRVVGGCTATENTTPRRPLVIVDGAATSDAGVVTLLDSELPFQALRSQHLVPSDVRVVVTASNGRQISELDGKPALPRLREIAVQLGGGVELQSYAFARYIDGVPYVRSIVNFTGDMINFASGVENGHVLRVMCPGDLIGTTRTDLALAAQQLGGISAILAFSCMGRHWDAEATHLTDELAAVYRDYNAVGMQSFGEQSGMLLVNHTLIGLAIGSPV